MLITGEHTLQSKGADRAARALAVLVGMLGVLGVRVPVLTRAPRGRLTSPFDGREPVSQQLHVAFVAVPAPVQRARTCQQTINTKELVGVWIDQGALVLHRRLFSCVLCLVATAESPSLRACSKPCAHTSKGSATRTQFNKREIEADTATDARARTHTLRERHDTHRVRERERTETRQETQGGYGGGLRALT